MKIGEDVDYEWDILVIGNNIHAVRYAYENKVPILFNCMPFFHSYEASSNDGFDTLEEEWAFKSYSLYEWCLNPFANSIDKIRIDLGKKKLKVFTSSGPKYEILYQNVFIFSLQGVYGLEHTFDEELLGYRVLDWFDVKRGGTIDLDLLEDKNTNFVKKIQLFTSTRRDGNHQSKDLVSESFLSRDQLNSIDYSDTMSKFKTISALRSNGCPNVKLELWRRDVAPVTSRKSASYGNITLIGVQ